MPLQEHLNLPATWRRYRALDVESLALRVVGRGLFLAVMLMIAFLFVFMRVTDLLAGQNEIGIPTTSVGADVDLGALVQGAFIRSSGATLSVIGVITLIVSAALTGHALHRGTRTALLGHQAERRPLISTAMVAIGVPILVLSTWLVALGTSIRRLAWSTLLHTDLDPMVVNVGKATAIALAVLVVLGAVLLAIRQTIGQLTPHAPIAALVVAVVLVACNFFLLYTYVGTLIRPQVSGGIALVLTVLLWVNVVVRTYLAAMCWVGCRLTSPASGASNGESNLR